MRCGGGEGGFPVFLSTCLIQTSLCFIYYLCVRIHVGFVHDPYWGIYRYIRKRGVGEERQYNTSKHVTIERTYLGSLPYL